MESISDISRVETDQVVCETELTVFRRSNIHGTGGYARQDLAAGTRIIEYVLGLLVAW